MSAEVRDHPLGDPLSLELIGELNADIEARYPWETDHFWSLDTDEVGPGRGAFVVVWDGDEPLGCGAVRLISVDDGAPGATYVELKRMYVRPAARGRRLGVLLLDELVTRARGLGATHVRLETGTQQHEAMVRYERYGFAHIPPWGEYVDGADSICLELALEKL